MIETMRPGKSRSRDFTFANVRQDLRDLFRGRYVTFEDGTRKWIPVLTFRAMLTSYRRFVDPLMCEVMRGGHVLQRCYGHNLRTTAGLDLEAQILGDTTGDAGTSTGVGATTLTDSGKTWTVNAWAGHRVHTGGVYGIVLSNTATVLTIDRWNTSPPGGAAASTPSTGAYLISSGGAHAIWWALTNTNITPAAGDTALSGELTADGLGRQVGTYSHTPGASSYKLNTTFTYTGSTAITAYAAGLLNAQRLGTMMFESSISPGPATVNESGDQIVFSGTGWTVNL